jgi:hypothetical protein
VRRPIPHGAVRAEREADGARRHVHRDNDGIPGHAQTTVTAATVVAVPGWRPQFFSVTDAAAFCRTDGMPLARWAKAAMILQAAGSLAILGLVIARAVTIVR